MSAETIRRKQFLFVDDDAGFLASIQELFTAMAQGSWEVFTAENHAQALALLDKRHVDVVVVDIGMPIMDGIQFLKLLGRAHPGQQVAMLTSRVSEENAKICLANGAALFLEKPAAPGGFDAIFSQLETLANSVPQAGFRGMMRRVGLPEVLQMECLGRKSSILEVFTTKVRGRIFIADGSIVHADSGNLQGELALYSLLALRGGEFNLLQFSEPPRRSISGQWEFLLMESARLVDEAAAFPEAEGGGPPAQSRTSEPVASDASSPERTDQAPAYVAMTPATGPSRVEEVVLCSGAGEVLYDWECKSLERRLKLLEQVEHQAAQVSNLAPVGRFDRLEILTTEGRIICEVLPHRRLFVRSAGVRGELR